MSSIEQKPVLISGAGPTGLVLAIWLQKFGVPYRLVDKSPRKATTSRAMVAHSRTLEFYRQLGIADDIVDSGMIIKQMAINHNRERKGVIAMANGGVGLSHYPFILSIPQDQHETQLEKILLRNGGQVEHGVEVAGFTQDDATDSVHVRLRKHHEDGTESEENFEASYIAGCDGAHSAVRAACPTFKMEGGTYERRFFVADLEIDGRPEFSGEFNMWLSDEDFCVLLPIKGSDSVRLVGFVPIEYEDKELITFDDVKSTADRNCKLQVKKVNWFSHYKVHHRCASSFRDGRAFILGDAAHLHSPAGGQGMNTGIGDATNLAWKLATAFEAKRDGAQSLAIDDILQSYETERIQFARTLVNTTDTAFTTLTGQSLFSRFFRNFLVPYVIPNVVHFFNFAPIMYKRVSQIGIEYRNSKLSSTTVGTVSGAVQAGDRLPYVEDAKGAVDGKERDNHVPIKKSKWHAQVYGEAQAHVEQALKERSMQLYSYAWTDEAKAKGLTRNATYLIRPDGHVGTIFAAGPGEDTTKTALGDYCTRWGIRGAMV